MATRCGHVALAGLPNVGKSSLLNTLVGEHLAIVSPKPQATRLPVVGLVTRDDTQYILHDLPGLLEPSYLMQARMREAALEAVAACDVVLHLHPADEAPAPAFAAVARLDRPLGGPVVTVYTKGDLVSAERRAALGAGGAVVVSADREKGIDALLAACREHLPEGPFQHDPDELGTQPLRFFVTEYLREAAFLHLSDELPYAFAAHVEEFREDRSPVYIRVTLYVERESQKGMVIGRGGQTLRAIGAHARGRLEALTGAPVYLDTWVKTLPKWRRNPAILSELGFPTSAAEPA